MLFLLRFVWLFLLIYINPFTILLCVAGLCLKRKQHSGSGLTDNEGALIRELVSGHLQVQWRRSLTNATGGIVMGAVAGAIVAAPVAGIRNWHTSQVRADANDHQPLGLDHALLQRE